MNEEAFPEPVEPLLHGEVIGEPGCPANEDRTDAMRALIAAELERVRDRARQVDAEFGK